MSGHSKWSTIKRKKQATDQARSGIFSKLTRVITSSVHEGGGIPDPEKNFKLRLAVERARTVNMPKDTIQRAIEKAVGGEGSQMKEVVYEGFGPHSGSGEAPCLLISTLTDNVNRTHSEVKYVLEKNGGKMGGQNSVAYMFQKCGVAVFKKENNEGKSVSEEQVYAFSDAIGALDLEEADEDYIVYLPFENIGRIKEYSGDVAPTEVDVFYRPTMMKVQLTDEEMGKLDELVEKLEELDDVQNVYSNVAS